MKGSDDPCWIGASVAEEQDEPRIRAIWRQLSLPQRLQPVAYLALGVALAAPWLRGDPFMSGSFGSGADPPTVVHGIGVFGGPLVLLAVLVGLGALLLGREGTLRVGASVAVFALAGAWVAAFYTWGATWTCFMCQGRTILWGAHLAALASGTGLVLSLLDVDWPALGERLRAELSEGP